MIDSALLKLSEVKEVWNKHFESVMMESMREGAKITKMGVQINVRQLYPEGEVEKGDI